MCENKENKDVKHVNLEGASKMGKNVVTNEEIIMEHLEEIELANACILLGITNIFQFILKRKEKYNVERYEEMAFASGIEAMQDQSERMLNMSKIKDKVLIKTRMSEEDIMKIIEEILK